MMRGPRSRQVLKWGAAVALAAVMLIWVASGRWYCWGIGTYTAFSINGGQLGFAWFGDGHGVQPGWTLTRTRMFEVWPGMPKAGRVSGPASGWSVIIPLWIPAVALVPLTVLAWRRDARMRRIERAGLCPRCDYDRAGLAPEAVCPECGTPPTAPRPSSAA